MPRGALPAAGSRPLVVGAAGPALPRARRGLPPRAPRTAPGPRDRGERRPLAHRRRVAGRRHRGPARLLAEEAARGARRPRLLRADGGERRSVALLRAAAEGRVGADAARVLHALPPEEGH